jgi:hypothetical protein
MARAPDWTDEEFLVVLRNSGVASEELAEQLPGRTVGAIDTVRQGLHEFHVKGTSSLISQVMVRFLDGEPSWTCCVCDEQQS